MKDKIGIIAVVLIVLLVLLIVTPLGTGQKNLNDAQRESLCEAFTSSEELEYEEILPSANIAAVKIFGVDRNGDNAYVYGYVSYGEYVKFKGSLYDMSGGNYPFKVKIKYSGDDVAIVKEYGDGVTDEATIKEYPLRYKIKYLLYKPYDNSGYCKVKKQADKKAEEVLGAPIDTQYTLMIDGNKYEIYNYNGDMEIIEKGTLQK